MSPTEIAVRKHRSGRPDTSTEDHFKPTASSKKIEDPHSRPPRKTTLFPLFTGVAEWYAAGGGLHSINGTSSQNQVGFNAVNPTQEIEPISNIR